MRLTQYLKEDRKNFVKFSKPKEHKTKDIHLLGNEITISTESPNPTAVSGIRNNISRKKYKDEDQAQIAFNKMIATAKKKGWKQN